MKTSLKRSNDRPMANPHRRGRSTRYRAWRNLMVAAINAGIEQRVFSLDTIEELPRGGVPYAFTLCGHAVIAHARDIGWDELTISAALCPTPDGRQWLDCFGTGFLAGEAHARGWLERRNGAWLQTEHGVTSLYCRRHLVPTLASVEIDPLGYTDHGEIML